MASAERNGTGGPGWSRDWWRTSRIYRLFTGVPLPGDSIRPEDMSSDPCLQVLQSDSTPLRPNQDSMWYNTFGELWSAEDAELRVEGGPQHDGTGSEGSGDSAAEWRTPEEREDSGYSSNDSNRYSRTGYRAGGNEVPSDDELDVPMEGSHGYYEEKARTSSQNKHEEEDGTHGVEAMAEDTDVCPQSSWVVQGKLSVRIGSDRFGSDRFGSVL